MKEFKLRASADDLDLSVIVAEIPEGIQQKGLVQIVHGMCEHKERYIPFMEFLASNGYTVVCHDHRGHGASVRNPADLGYFYEGGWNAMVEDIKLVGDKVRADYPGGKFILFGHSMGSIAVRCYAKRYDDSLDCLYVCGCPSDNPAKGVGQLLAKMYGRTRGWNYRPELMQKISFGAYNKPFKDEGYKSAWVCSDKETLESYHNDPLCQYVFTANGFYNLMCMLKDCYSPEGWKVASPSLPIRFISGAEDPCRISDAALEGAVGKMRKVGYSDVTLKVYDGMRHEILNESGKQQVWDDVLATLGTL